MIDWRCEAWLSNDDCTLRGLWDGGTFSTNCISQTAVSGVNTFVMNQGKNITVALTGVGLEGARGSVWAMICQTAAGGSTHRKCNKQRANDVSLRRLQVPALRKWPCSSSLTCAPTISLPQVWRLAFLWVHLSLTAPKTTWWFQSTGHSMLHAGTALLLLGFLQLLKFPPIDHKRVYDSFPVIAGMDTSTPINLVKNKQHQSNCNSKKNCLM